MASEGLRERERELAALERERVAALGGSGRLLVVEGPAGIGKTSLLQAVRDDARSSGARVLSARGSELEARFPFGVVHQLLGPTVFAADPAERARWLSGAAARCADVFEAPGAVAADGQAGDELYGKLHGLYWLCASLAQQGPLVVLLDDAQWCDEPSLRFAGFLARRIEELPVLFVVGTRPARDAGPALAQLVTDAGATVLRPAPLSEAAVGAWVRDELEADAEAGFTAAIHGVTDGNPFLLRELLREVSAEGVAPTAAGARRVEELTPEGVAAVVLRRLAELPPDAGRLARALAVLGGSAAPSVAAALADLDEAACAPAIAALVGAGIVDDRTSLGFAHPLVRRTVYRDVPAPERTRAHSRAAALLADRGAADDEI
ncbi:MAG TPA: AAA family ATPase, partial [Capillimicrobium sp.]